MVIMENRVLGPAVLRGEATVVAALLKERFGVVPDWVLVELDGASERQLLTWPKRVLTAKTLDGVFKHHNASK